MEDKVQRREREDKRHVQYQLVASHQMYACIFLRKTCILASMKDKGQRTRDGGIEDGKQRSNGHEQSHKKGTLGQLIGRVQRFGNKEQSRERGDRGRETRSKAVRRDRGLDTKRQSKKT
jgi:hypothetical protein